MVEIHEIPSFRASSEGTTNANPAAGSPARPTTNTHSTNTFQSNPLHGVDVGQLLAQLGSAWEELEYAQKQQAVLIAVLVFYLFYNYIFTIVLGLLIYQYLVGRKPKPETFMVFFEEWFTRDYYPHIVHKLKSELEERRLKKEKDGNYIGVVFDMFKKSLLNSTKDLQAQLVLEAVKTNSSPILVRDKAIYSQVSMNLGSKEEPSLVTFWGINGRWHLAPYISLDFENISILNSLEQ